MRRAILTALALTLTTSAASALTFYSINPKHNYSELCNVDNPKKQDGSEAENNVPCVSRSTDDTIIYEVHDKKYTIKTIGEKKGLYTRIKINGKPGMMTEVNRNEFTIITDDRTVEFTNTSLSDSVLPSSFNGVYTSDATLKTGCRQVRGEYAADTFVIAGSRLKTQFGICKIRATKKMSDLDSYASFVSCDDEDGIKNTVLTLSKQPDNMLSVSGDFYHRCPIR